MSTSQWTVSDSPTPPSSAGGWTVSDSPTPPAPSLTDNPNGEGVYQMRDQGGKQVGIPYSNITTATGKGHYFSNPQEQARFEKDNEADRQNTDPYLQRYSVAPGEVGKGGWTALVKAGKGMAGTFGPPNNAGEALAGPAAPLVRMGQGYVQSAGQGLSQARNYFKAGSPVRGAATVLGALNPLSSGPTASINEGADQGKSPGEIIGEGVADAAMVATPELAKAVVPKIPAMAEKTAGGILNRTVGSLKGDFARGANPGRGYVRSGAGPAGSMEGLASKSADALDDAGGKLGDAYDNATAQGKLIPTDDVRQAIDRVINDAKNSAQGPGVLADPAAYDELRKTFDPSLQSAAQKGGFSPRELWDIRRNMDRNLNWGDQSKLNMTKVQQRTSGAIGGVMEDHIPELKDLNQQYQDLSKFSNRAEQRALTGSSPLTKLASKAAYTGAGALMGAAGHSPGWELAGAAVGAGLDSIPAKTTLATGINAAGKAASVVTPVAGEAALPFSLAAVGGNRSNNSPGNNEKEKEQGSNDNQSGQPVEQGNPQGQQNPSIPATVQNGDASPQTHVFSMREWRQANPGGDPAEARQSAETLGYEVVD